MVLVCGFYFVNVKYDFFDDYEYSLNVDEESD